MDEEKKWMLMTYYCPTHGDSGLVKPIQLTKKEISKILFLTIYFFNNYEVRLDLKISFSIYFPIRLIKKQCMEFV